MSGPGSAGRSGAGAVTPALVGLAGGPVEYALIPGGNGPPLVFLHEGLGSLGLWRGVPADLAARTGRRALVWSRHGYGRSAAVRAARPVTYMHHEALAVLPELLDALLPGEAPVLVGHSDGASIALIHAGGSGREVAGVVAIAPHVLVEERTLEGIRAARHAYDAGDLRTRLGRHHDDVDATFGGWNDIWLRPDFAAWNIEEYLPAVTCPVLVVQAEDDPYGTLDQVERVAGGAAGPVRRLVLDAGGHAPHLTRTAEVVEAVAGFIGLP